MPYIDDINVRLRDIKIDLKSTIYFMNQVKDSNPDKIIKYHSQCLHETREKVDREIDLILYYDPCINSNTQEYKSNVFRAEQRERNMCNTPTSLTHLKAYHVITDNTTLRKKSEHIQSTNTP